MPLEEVSQLNPVLLNACRSELLQALETESESTIRRKICDAVAEFARAAIGNKLLTAWALLGSNFN